MQNQVLEGVIDFFISPRYLDKTKPTQWAVLQVKSKQQGRVIAAGEIPYCQRGEVFEFEGQLTKDKKGRMAFRFTRAKRSQQGEQGSLSYLTHLFGPKTAQKISQYFGSAEEGLKTFKSDPMALVVIKGISQKTVKKAQDKHASTQVAETLVTQLEPYGMTLTKAVKIFNKYGDEAWETIKENPYRLLMDVDGFTFHEVDRMALGYFKLPNRHLHRMEAGIFHTMRQSLQQGDSYMDYDWLIKKTGTLLQNVNPAFIHDMVASLIKKGRLIQEPHQSMVYLPTIHKYEREIAKHVHQLVSPRYMDDSVLQEGIDAFTQSSGMVLSPSQKNAIRSAVLNRFSIITGPPGSGKTTIINGILHVLSHANPGIQVGLAAPTGKAAKRMNETTKYPAHTIHKLLKFRPDAKATTFEYNKENPLPYDVVIVDEFSMMDLPLTYHLLEAFPPQGQLILVGDVDQLPSVGPGQVLKDFIQSKRIPTVRLNHIYRQAQGSTILERALDVSKGKIPSLDDSHDFSFLEDDDIVSLQEAMLDRYFEDVRQYGLDEVTILSPMRKTDVGVAALNRSIQMELNPPASYKKETKFGDTIFREGDKVIQIKPNDEEGLVNGQIGYIVKYIPEDRILREEEKLIVNFDGDKQTYTRDRFNEIQLAYAMTIHKSQGSEWKSVFIPIWYEHEHMLEKELIYTAMTRAKEKLHLFGSKEVFERNAQKRPKVRKSRLKDRIWGVI